MIQIPKPKEAYSNTHGTVAGTLAAVCGEVSGPSTGQLEAGCQ